MPKGVYFRTVWHKSRIKGSFVKGHLPTKGCFKKGHVPWMKGRTHTAEVRHRQSLLMQGRLQSEDTVRKRSLALLGKKYPGRGLGSTRHFSKEFLEQLRKRMRQQKYVLGRQRTELEKEKIRMGVRGNKNFLGHRHTAESKQKISSALKGRVFSKEWLRKMSEAQRGEKSHRWRGGVSKFPYPFSFGMELKEWIKTRDGHICRLCRISEKAHQNKYHGRLHVHHIDYDKNNCLESNLITLCKVCNSKVNFNRDHWSEYFKKVLS